MEEEGMERRKAQDSGENADLEFIFHGSEGECEGAMEVKRADRKSVV